MLGVNADCLCSFESSCGLNTRVSRGTAVLWSGAAESEGIGLESIVLWPRSHASDLGSKSITFSKSKVIFID